MRHPSRRFLLSGLIALWAAPRAFAAADARALYRDGAFLNAAEAALAAGRASGRAEDLVLASRALLAQCIVEPHRGDAGALLARASEAAEAALAADAASIDARLQLTAAIGMRGRRASLNAAIRAGYAPRGKRLIDDALARAPNSAWGRALLGGWHLEILRRGGRMGAMAYGARLSEGLGAFERARALAPNDIVIAAHYGLSLLTLNPDRYAARAGAQLEAAGEGEARDALERHFKRTARSLNAVLADNAQAARQAALAAFP
ncbi:MAG: hypothetical protein AB7O04_14630 [Hyphomonadaceae bacterium]